MTDFKDAQEFAEAMMEFRYFHKPRQRYVVPQPHKASRSKFDYEDIKAMRLAGKPAREIAEKYKVSEASMRNYMKRKRILLPEELRYVNHTGGAKENSGRKRSVDREKMKELRLEGASVKEIAMTLGCSTKTVFNILRQEGINARKEAV